MLRQVARKSEVTHLLALPLCLYSLWREPSGLLTQVVQPLEISASF